MKLIWTEHVRNGPNLNRTFMRRKGAKRTFPWDLTVEEIQLCATAITR
jgi:hypothetical protein